MTADEALQYVIERGRILLQSGKLTPDMAMGVSLILGIAKVKQEELRRGENGRLEKND